MDEIINISVNGYSLTKDGNCAGTQGECNSTKLRISFDQNWSEYAKSITFWDALGNNPVKIQFGTNLLEDIATSYDVYLVPIPGEAMTESGEMSFVIDGIIDGKVKRSVEGKLKVMYSPKADNAGAPKSVTPNLAEQMRAEIDAVIGSIAEAKTASSTAVNASLLAEIYKGEANRAAADATTARHAIEDMYVTSETIEAGAGATISKTTSDGRVKLHFGIPAGESGVYMGADEPTDPDIRVWLDTSGDADDALRVKKLIIGNGAELYMDEWGGFNIEKPDIENELGVPNIGGCLSIDNGELLFNGMPVGAGGGSNIKDLTADLTHNPLTETEKANFMRNTGLDAILGEMDAAIDEILEAQEALIGGDGE